MRTWPLGPIGPMGFPFRLISTPPAFPTSNRTFADVSTSLVSCGSSDFDKTFFPSDEMETQVFSSALKPTFRAALLTAAAATTGGGCAGTTAGAGSGDGDGDGDGVWTTAGV